MFINIYIICNYMSQGMVSPGIPDPVFAPSSIRVRVCRHGETRWCESPIRDFRNPSAGDAPGV